jgi:hypothetical protein
VHELRCKDGRQGPQSCSGVPLSQAVLDTMVPAVLHRVTAPRTAGQPRAPYCPMTRWVASPKPKAELLPETLEPEKQPDGTEVQIFSTAFGVRFARVVEPSGFVLWRKEIKTP